MIELPAEIRMGSSIESDRLDIVGDKDALATRDTDTYVKIVPELFDRLFVQFPLSPIPLEEIRSARIVMLLRTDVQIADHGRGWVDVTLGSTSGSDYGLGKEPESHPGEYVEVSRLMLASDYDFLTEEWASAPGYGYHPSVRADPYTPDGWVHVYIAYLAILLNESGRRRLPHLRGFQRGSDGQGITGGKRGFGNRSRQASIRRGPGSFY